MVLSVGFDGAMRTVLSLLLSVALSVGGAIVLSPPAQAAPTDFVSLWDTTEISNGSSAAQSIQLPLVNGGSYNFTVNWGDGNSGTVVSWNDPAASHSYATPGQYTVTISGTISGFAFQNSGDRNKLLDVSQWGSLALGNTEGQFQGAENFTETATDAPNLSATTSLKNAFAGATDFNGNINNWNVSTITNLESTFEGAVSFNQPLNSWNVSNVEIMRSVFYDASAFNQDLSSWNVSKVWHFGIMFFGAASFSQSLANWDIASGGITAGHETWMDGMLSGTAMSRANYGATLVGWAALPNIGLMHPNQNGDHAPNLFEINQSAPNTPQVAAARAALITNGWIINDNGLAEPQIPVGQTGRFSTVFTNSTQSALNVGSFTIAGDNANEFSIVSTTCVTTITPGSSCTITYDFSPGFSGKRSIELELRDAVTPDLILAEPLIQQEGSDAACNTIFTQGLGTMGSPFEVSTLAQLNCIAAIDADGRQQYLDKAFRMVNDIDAGGSDALFNPLGNAYAIPFKGDFNGDGHTLSNMTIVSSFSGFAPWMTNGAAVRNLTFSNVNFQSQRSAGVVSSYVDGSCTISNVHVNGSISGELGGDYGGLAGWADATTIERSSADIDISVAGSETARIGGLVGNAGSGLHIDRSWASGAVNTGTGAATDFRAGGLVGSASGVTIQDSYSLTTIAVSFIGSANIVGGLVGFAENSTVSRAYALGALTAQSGATVNGVIGSVPINTANLIASVFWDPATSLVTVDSYSGAGSTGPSTAVLQAIATYLTDSWDMTVAHDPNKVWFLPAGSYPVLAWQGSTMTVPPTVQSSSSGNSGSSSGLSNASPSPVGSATSGAAATELAQSGVPVGHSLAFALLCVGVGIFAVWLTRRHTSIAAR